MTAPKMPPAESGDHICHHCWSRIERGTQGSELTDVLVSPGFLWSTEPFAIFSCAPCAESWRRKLWVGKRAGQ